MKLLGSNYFHFNSLYATEHYLYPGYNNDIKYYGFVFYHGFPIVGSIYTGCIIKM